MEQVKREKLKVESKVKKKEDISIKSPVVKRGFKEVFDSIFRFVAVGGDFV